MDTLRVVIRSRTAWPASAVTVATSLDWDHPLVCGYEADADQWACRIPVDRTQPQTRLKFISNGQWQLPPGDAGNLIIPQVRYDDAEVRFDDVQFPIGTQPEDWSVPAQFFFRPDRNESAEWDYIIVGSGMGGGVLAHSLAHRQAPVPPRILLIEEGSYLFPTHVGNLPRRHNLGDVSKSIWDLYFAFRRADYTAKPDRDQIDVATGINFGGRSIYWGSTAPRMADHELARWPQQLRDVAAFYDAAEQLMRIAPAPGSPLQQAVIGALGHSFPAWVHEPAPMAVEYQAPAPSAIPAGVFSTAALLLEDRLQSPDAVPSAASLFIHLTERGTRVLHAPAVDAAGQPDPAGRDVTGVEVLDLRGDVTRQYRLAPGGAVILAAGALGTPQIAQASQLPLARVGQGLTDHPVLFRHFRIPDGNEFCPIGGAHPSPGGAIASSKTLSRNPAPAAGGAAGRGGYNVLLEIGANFNQARFSAPQELARVVADESTSGTWCEIVFLVDADLVETNQVTVNAAGGVELVMDACALDDAARAEMDAAAQTIIAELGGELPGLLPGGRFLIDAKLGAVAHEVGTMRAGAADSLTAGAAVVDTDLRVGGFDNLYVCDLSAFPTSPASNPSLTLAALALRLASRI